MKNLLARLLWLLLGEELGKIYFDNHRCLSCGNYHPRPTRPGCGLWAMKDTKLVTPTYRHGIRLPHYKEFDPPEDFSCPWWSRRRQPCVPAMSTSSSKLACPCGKVQWAFDSDGNRLHCTRCGRLWRDVFTKSPLFRKPHDEQTEEERREWDTYMNISRISTRDYEGPGQRWWE